MTTARFGYTAITQSSMARMTITNAIKFTRSTLPLWMARTSGQRFDLQKTYMIYGCPYIWRGYVRPLINYPPGLDFDVDSLPDGLAMKGLDDQSTTVSSQHASPLSKQQHHKQVATPESLPYSSAKWAERDLRDSKHAKNSSHRWKSRTNMSMCRVQPVTLGDANVLLSISDGYVLKREVEKNLTGP